MSPASRHSVQLVGLWAVVLGTALVVRPLLPVDETRYLAVAWEMWQRGDLLVPYLNGEPYSHKPPLLFWFIHLGWSVFGVNEWWPRLIAPLFSLANLYLTYAVARQLWPHERETALAAPWVLFGGLLWAMFFTLLQFDLLLVFCTLLGVKGLVNAARGEAYGWLLLGLGLGLGALSKGPVVLIHLVPVALLAPLWVRQPVVGWGAWYAGFSLSLIGGALIALAWAIPAARAGGDAYAQAIFWGQSAGRLVDAFAHRQPAWWYFAWLPVLLLPWVLWSAVWQGLRNPGLWKDEGTRMIISWIVPALLILSVISGKQVKYLLPVLPGFALLIARSLGFSLPTPGRLWAVAGMLFAGGMTLLLLPALDSASLPFWASRIPWYWGLLSIGAAVVLLFFRPATAGEAVRRMTFGSALLVMVTHLSLVQTAASAYDLEVVSERIRHYQAAGKPVANVGKYHGQFQFLGRLAEPLVSVDAADAATWARANPDGYLVFYAGVSDIPTDGSELSQAYRTRPAGILIWQASKFLMLE